MPRTKKVVTSQLELTSCISLFYLCKSYSKSVIDAAIVRSGSKERRVRVLPSNVIFYYTLALVMYPGVAAKEVMRILLDNIGFKLGVSESTVVAKSGITKARKRLGYKSLKDIYDSQVKPIATKDSKGCFYKGLRLVAIDGTVLNLPDSKENNDHFKRQMSGNKSPFPQARMVTIAECGTHVIFNSKIDSVKVGEITMAKTVLKSLKKDMLCTADRHYFCFELFDIAHNTGASLLFRVRNSANLPVKKVYSDHSYLSRIRSHDKKREIEVRVIELISKSIDSQTGEKKEETYRFITNILDYKRLPANDVSQIYRNRWEIETAFKELKISLPNYQSMIRAKLPELVYQEIYAMLLVHSAVRKLMHEAAISTDIDVDELSFTHSLNVVKRKSQNLAIFPPQQKTTSSINHI